jgi:hypothetical protein
MFDPVSIGLMLGSAALSAHANSQAAKKQRQAAVEAQQRQNQQRNLATDAALKRALEFDAGKRNESQEQIAQEMTESLQAEVAQPGITAQGVQVGATLPEGEGGGDYLKAKAREQAKSTESLRALAALMGRTGSAAELRRREAVGIGDTAGEIGRIGTHAGNIFQADQVGIQAAGTPSIGLQLGAAALGAAGMGRMATAGVPSAPAGTPTANGVGFNLGAPSGMGLKPGARGLGLKI